MECPETGHDMVNLGVESTTGDPWNVRTPGTWGHVLACGETGAGKSTTMRRYLAQLCGRPNVAMYGIDMKGGLELGLFRDRFTEIASDADHALELLVKIRLLVEHRMELMKRADVSSWDPDWGPWLLLSIDEFAEFAMPSFGSVLASVAGDDGALKAEKPRIAARVAVATSLAQLARAMGVMLTVSTQYPIASILPSDLRLNMTDRWAHRLPGLVEYKVALGNDGAAKEAVADPTTKLGQCHVWKPGSTVPVRHRAAYHSEDQCRERARSKGRLRWADDKVFEGCDLSQLRLPDAA